MDLCMGKLAHSTFRTFLSLPGHIDSTGSFGSLVCSLYIDQDYVGLSEKSNLHFSCIHLHQGIHLPNMLQKPQASRVSGPVSLPLKISYSESIKDDIPTITEKKCGPQGLPCPGRSPASTEHGRGPEHHIFSLFYSNFISFSTIHASKIIKHWQIYRAWKWLFCPFFPTL